MGMLSVKYLGLGLKSPVIVSSSRLTSTIPNLIEAQKNGAGAVVLKSLFEEQINIQAGQIPDIAGYPEADDYIRNYSVANSVDEYLTLIKNAKKELSIPVIPSVNCYTSGSWIDFAKKMEDAGADAIEVNMFFLPDDRKLSGSAAEKTYFELAEKLTKQIRVPVAIKLGFRFSNILYIIDQLYMRGIKGVVLFNRFYEPDIDLEKMEVNSASVFSTASESRYVLRWVAMAASQDIKIDISASTGVHSSEEALKYLLAGAGSVQVCSVLYKNGLSYLKDINNGIESWMTDKKFTSVNEIKGKLSWKNSDKPAAWERTQFMKYFASEE